MRELQDHNSLGTLYEDEAVVVITGNISLLHDTIKSGSVFIYSDEAHTTNTTEFNFTLKNEELPDGEQFIAFAFDAAFIALHDTETWYVTYKSFGDIVEAEDINDKAYRYDKFEAGETLLSNKAVCLKSGKLYYADNTDVTTINVLGITRQAGSVGDKLEVYLIGEISDSAFSFDTTLNIFVGENGGLTQTQPTTGYSGAIAKPITSNRIKIIELVPIVL